jgi:hypothetical protein
MSKRSAAIDSIPPAVLNHLRVLGENLAVARKRRLESRKVWSQRIGVGVSAPTFMRIEKGDPSVFFGVFATALWLMGRSGAIPDLAAPEHDLGALEAAVRPAKLRSARKQASIE